MLRARSGADILHADLDAFYASVEQLLDPTLRGRPIAVGGGVVLAASYEARRHGVRAGMPGWMARQLCGPIEFVAGHFAEYQKLGDAVVAVFHDFTPWVERVSIDEAFLDVSGSVHLFGPPAAIAATIRARVREEIGLPLSIGVARTKPLAKVASQVAKPDGLVVVAPGAERGFLERLPVGLISGVGPVTEARLRDQGIRTIGQLAGVGSPIFDQLLGPSRPVEGRPAARSMGAQAALGRRRPTPELIRETLGYLADRVGGRLRRAGMAGRTVTVRVRFPPLRSVTRGTTLRRPVSSTLALTEVACGLAHAALADHPAERDISLLGLSVSNLRDELPSQMELPVGPGVDRSGRGLDRSGRGLRRPGPGVDRSVDAIRARFGRSAIGYATLLLSEEHRVPEAFRELAERAASPNPEDGS